MRPGMLLTLTLSWLALSVCTQPLSAKTTRVSAGQTSEAPTLKVEGRWQSTEKDAWSSAEAQAQAELTDHFREQGIIFHTPATMPELRPLLAKQWKYTPESKIFPDGVGMMHRIVLEVPVTPEIRNYLLQRERDARVQERMIWLGKITAGLIVLLVAATGYLRLDDYTKGYFTTWLLLGVGAVVICGLVAVCLM